MLNTRQRYEIKTLVERGCVDLVGVAEHFGVSLRSVRYDIDGLNKKLLRNASADSALSVLNAYSNPIVVHDKVAYVDERISHSSLVGLLNDPDDIGAAPLPLEERVLVIVSMLCCTDDFITVRELTEELQVSRATVTRDLVKVYEYCGKNGLELEHSRGHVASVHRSERWL